MPWKETKTWFLLNGFVYEKGGGSSNAGEGRRLNAWIMILELEILMN